MRNGDLENPLSQITREKEAVSPLPAQRGEKAELGHTHVLCLIHDGEVERRISTFLQLPCQQAEHVRPGYQTLILKF